MSFMRGIYFAHRWSRPKNMNTLRITPLRSLLAACLALLATVSAFAQAAAPAAATPPPPPAPTLEQRIAGLEAYIGNGDPSASLKDAKGNIPAGLTTPSVNVAGPGHNAWMMTSAALVLFMTLPGLALFYGGLVRTKNVLSVMAQCLALAGLVTILWWAFGYSLVFGKSFNSPFLGGSEFFFMKGVDSAPNTDYAFWVSQNVFSMYQMMFAIITPALIVGAIAERMKFSAMILFMTAWMFIVYFPAGPHGVGRHRLHERRLERRRDDQGDRLRGRHGGAHVFRLVGAHSLYDRRPRLGFGKTPMPPHSLVLCMVGTGMLWVGWYGFNAGSAVAADGVAANAFTTTTLATGPPPSRGHCSNTSSARKPRCSASAPVWSRVLSS
jgi:Amt family ammonium transporter